MADTLIRDLSTPLWFPHAVDPVQDRVLLVRRDEAALKAASFLDDRSLTATSVRTLVSWGQLAEAVSATARRDAQYIFHIGHVGSTLLSRLLGELPAVLSLREPLLLRSVYEADQLAGRPECPWDPDSLDARIDTITALLSRTFAPGQRALIKATSFTSEIAGRLVPKQSGALLMYVSARSYLENILAGEASRQELQQLAGGRLARLTRRLGEQPDVLWDMGQGARAALGWLCEMLSLEQAARSVSLTRWCDFDRFLVDPAAELMEVSAFFGEPLEDDEAEALCAGPIMGRYSKAPEHQYSPRLRQDLLAQSRRENKGVIKDALAWLERMGALHGLVAKTLERAG